MCLILEPIEVYETGHTISECEGQKSDNYLLAPASKC